MYWPQPLITLTSNPSIRDFPNLESIVRPFETSGHLLTPQSQPQQQSATNFFTESFRLAMQLEDRDAQAWHDAAELLKTKVKELWQSSADIYKKSALFAMNVEDRDTEISGKALLELGDMLAITSLAEASYENPKEFIGSLLRGCIKRIPLVGDIYGAAEEILEENTKKDVQDKLDKLNNAVKKVETALAQSGQINDRDINTFIQTYNAFFATKIFPQNVKLDSTSVQNVIKKHNQLINSSPLLSENSKRNYAAGTCIVADFISLKNPKAGNIAKALGTSSLMTFEGISQLRDLWQKGAKFLDYLPAAGLLMQGIKMGLYAFSMWGEGVGTNVVYDQLKILSKAVHQMMTQQQEGFDQLKKLFGTMFVSMLEKFADLSTDIANLENVVVYCFQHVDNKLDNLALLVNRLATEQSLWNLQDLIAQANIQTSMKIKWSTYSELLTKLLAWAIDHSRTPLLTDPGHDRDFSAQTVVKKLKNQPIEFTIKYLADYLSSKLQISSRNISNLANMLVWAKACDAYVSYRMAFPEFENKLFKFENNSEQLKIEDDFGEKPKEHFAAMLWIALRLRNFVYVNQNIAVNSLLERYKTVVVSLSRRKLSDLKNAVSRTFPQQSDALLLDLEAQFLLLKNSAEWGFNPSFKNDPFFIVMFDESTENARKLINKDSFSKLLNKISDGPKADYQLKELFSIWFEAIELFKDMIRQKLVAIQLPIDNPNKANEFPISLSFMINKIKAAARKCFPKDASFAATPTPVLLPKTFSLAELLPDNLIFHASMGHISQVRTIIENGSVDLEKTDSLQRTAMHYAAMAGSVDVVNFLLTNGAEVNVEDCAKNTPLHLAAQVGTSGLISLLMAAGSDPHAKNQFGETVMDVARNFRQINFINKLQEVLNARVKFVNYAAGPIASPVSLQTAHGYGGVVRELSGNRVACAGGRNSNIIQIWDLDKKQCVQQIKYSHQGHIYSLEEFSGNRLASGGGGSIIYIWNIQDGKLLQTLNSNCATHVEYLKTTDDRLISAGLFLHIWDLKNNKCLMTISQTRPYLVSYLANNKLVIGKHTATGTTEGLYLWDIQANKCLRKFKDIGNATFVVPFSEDKFVVVANEGLRLYDVNQDNCLKIIGWPFKMNPGGFYHVACARLLPNNYLITSGTVGPDISDYGLAIWDINQGKLMKTIPTSIKGGRAYASRIAILDDGRLVGSFGDSTLQIWEFPQTSINNNPQNVRSNPRTNLTL